MEEERIKALEENIKTWREELDTVWQGRDTDAAEVERRNLRDLINNAEREINQLRGNAEIVNENPEERFNKLKEEFEKIKQGNSDDKLVEINKLKLQIERMKEERENYASRKNTEYKEIYDAYTKGTDRKEKVIVTDEKTGEQKEEEKTIHSKGIEDLEKDLEQLEKEYEKGKSGERDKNIRAVTALRQEYDKQIKDKEKEIREIKRQIEDIELGTDEAMVEKELSDGTKVKTPKILELNKDLDKLEKELRELISNRDECEKVINQLKGIEKEEKPEYTAQQNAEYTKYFHGQGDIPENTRDDRRANDEYFGFEKPRDGKKPIEPVGKDPGGKTPPPPGPGGKEPEGKKPPEKDPKLPIDPEKTGLQIFRREFNNMPEILKKHTFSENPALPIPGSLALALATAGVVTGPIGWAGAAGVAAVSYLGAKPILRKITGQAKLEKQITEQFNNMDPEDLLKMADYLDEETIINLKPNAVILRALNKSLRTYANRENAALKEEIKQDREERDSLLSKDSLTESEEKRLGELKREIDSKKKEIDSNEKRFKNARRGRERVSAAYKGNVGKNKILNIFHRRNTTTKDYKDALNEYADAELEKIVGEKEENNRKAAKGQRMMEDIGDKYTYASRLGILKSPFNMPQSEVRIVSDQKDNTIRNIGVIAMAGAALTRTVRNMLDMQDTVKEAADQVKQQQTQYQDLQKSIGKVTDHDIEGTGRNIADDIYNRGEAAAVHANGTVSRWNPQYVNDDQQAQNLGDAVSSQIDNGALSKGTLGDKIRQLGKLLSGNESQTAAQNLQNSIQNSNNITGAGVDHTEQFSNLSNVTQHTSSNATLYEKLAEIIDKAQNLKPVAGIKEVTADFVGPIAAALTTALGTIGVDAKRNHEIKKDMQVNESEQKGR